MAMAVARFAKENEEKSSDQSHESQSTEIVIQSGRACTKKRQKTEGESENEARSLEEGKRVCGILVVWPNFVLPGNTKCSSLREEKTEWEYISEEVEADCGGEVDCQSVEIDKAAGVCKGTVTH
ncbi:unnamed protein product [Sphagnum tenellum]